MRLALSIPRLVGVSAALGLAVGCTMGGQEGEDARPPSASTSTWSSTSPGTGTGAGTGAAGTGTGGGTTAFDGDDDFGGVDGGDTGDTGDTGSAGACGRESALLYLSPDDSNSYASARLAQARLADGWTAGAVRAYEIFNYYDFDVEPGPAGSVSLSAEWIEDGLGPEDYALQIQVGAEARELAGRAPLNLTFVLDTSGSMSGAPLARMKDSCEAIAARLALGDTVSMVTWDTQNSTVLAGHAVSGPSDPVVLGACDALSANGGTDLAAGLAAGYALADQHWIDGQTNRVVLVSDGGANVGITDEQLIAERAWRADGREIFLVGIGVGDSGYNDLLMDTVTDAGRGATVFVDSSNEAWNVLHDRFLQVFEVAVTDVRLELWLPEQLEITGASAEQVSTDPDAVRPQYLAPNAEMVFYNELSTPVPTCLTDASEIVATVSFVDPGGTTTLVQHAFTVGELRQADARNALKGRALFLYAQALAATNVGEPDLSEALSRALIALDAADVAWPGDPDLAEVRSVLSQL